MSPAGIRLNAKVGMYQNKPKIGCFIEYENNLINLQLQMKKLFKELGLQFMDIKKLWTNNLLL